MAALTTQCALTLGKVRGCLAVRAERADAPRLGTGALMAGTIQWHYDQANAVLVAKVQWSIRTADDVAAWLQQWKDIFARYPRKVDLVAVMDEFHVDAAMAPAWGRQRAELLREHTRFSCRVSCSPKVHTFVITSGIRYDAAADEAPTVEAALEKIRAARVSAGLAPAEGNRPAVPPGA